MGNLQVRFLEGWAPAMAPGYSTLTGLRKGWPSPGTQLQKAGSGAWVSYLLRVKRLCVQREIR
jgi:hypothetical protein